MRSLALLIACCLILSGCRAPGLLFPRTGHGGSRGDTPDLVGYVQGPGAARAALTMQGQVSFASRAAQGTIEEVAVGATVSLINTGSNLTVVTGLTDAKGDFTLLLPRTFRPDPSAVYYLEAIKGIGGNLPGNPAVRVRTIAKYRSGGWVTLNSSQPNSGIRITPASTALAAAVALLRDAGRSVSLDALIGSLSGSTYSPVPGLSSEDFARVEAIIAASLAERRDPLAGVGFNTATGDWERTGSSVPMAVTAIAPTSGNAGVTVTFVGAGFTPGSTAVARFNGTPQTADQVTATEVSVRVPNGATSGQTTLQIGNVIALGPAFTVPVRIEALSTHSGAPGMPVTLTGSGFDPSALANNQVWFGGAEASVVSAAPRSLVVTVPTSALAGPVTVSVLGSGAESPAPFYPALQLATFNPASAEPGAIVTLTGTGFHAEASQNLVTFNGTPAEVVEVEPGRMGVRVPALTGAGPIAVTVNGARAESETPFALAAQAPPLANALIEAFAGTTRFATPVTATNWPLSANDLAFNPAGEEFLATGYGVIKVSPAGVASLVVSSAQLDNAPVRHIACDPAGTLYVGTNNRIYRYRFGEGLSHLAGNGGWGPTGDGGPAVMAGIGYVKDLVADNEGNVYVIDSGCIRRITAGGLVTRIAGGTAEGYGGDGGPAVDALLRDPRALCLDGQGGLFVADYGNHRIRWIDAGGWIDTVAGDGTPSNGQDGYAPLTPMGLALGENGALYVTDYRFVGQFMNSLREIELGSGMVTTRVQNGMTYHDVDGKPQSLANFLPGQVAVAPSGEVHTLETVRNLKWAPTNGMLQVAVGNETSDFGGDGQAALNARLNRPSGLAQDALGNLYVADTANHRVRMIDPSGTITTVAGNGKPDGPAQDGMPALTAALASPTDVAVGSQGLYVACADAHRVWRVDGAGNLRLVAGTGTPGSSGDGGLATHAQLARPVALWAEGETLYVAESDGRRIRAIGPDQRIATVAGNGNATFVGDGTLATATGIGTPAGLARDAQGRLYVSDQHDHTVRRIEADGTMVTIAGKNGPGHGGDGGPATEAWLNQPAKLSIDGAVLYVADTGNHCVRQIDATGVIRTVAGVPTQSGFGGDGGIATAAFLSWPVAVLADPANGRLLVADTENNRLRRLR